MGSVIGEVTKDVCFENILSDIIIDFLVFLGVTPTVIMLFLKLYFHYNILYIIAVLPININFILLDIYGIYSCYYQFCSKITQKN